MQNLRLNSVEYFLSCAWFPRWCTCSLTFCEVVIAHKAMLLWYCWPFISLRSNLSILVYPNFVSIVSLYYQLLGKGIYSPCPPWHGWQENSWTPSLTYSHDRMKGIVCVSRLQHHLQLSLHFWAQFDHVTRDTFEESKDHFFHCWPGFIELIWS